MTNCNPFIKKLVTKKIDKYTYLAILSIYIFIINAIYIYYNNFKVTTILKVSPKIHFVCLITALLSILPSFIYLNLIQEHDISLLNPIITPLGLILTAIIGMLFFKEKCCKTKVYGGIIILIGTYIFLKKK